MPVSAKLREVCAQTETFDGGVCMMLGAFSFGTLSVALLLSTHSLVEDPHCSLILHLYLMPLYPVPTFDSVYVDKFAPGISENVVNPGNCFCH